MARGKKPARAHKSKVERKKLDKVSAVRIIGGFVQRTAKPEVTGSNRKSQMVRVDADFAAFLRMEAVKHGGITEVTRKLNEKAAVLSAMIQPDEPGA